MNYEDIKKLIEDMGNSKIDALDIEFPDGVKISMKKNTAPVAQVQNVQIDTTAAKEEKKDEKVIKSPMVGTFYASNSPKEEPFVKVTKNDYLSIAGGRMGKRDAMQMWPLESRMPVYYNPFKPQMSFVEKIPEKLSIVGLVFLLTGAFLIIFSVILFYMMNKL